MKILIFGLPDSGKTWLAERLQKHFDCAWFNADKIREMANDWVFDDEARVRQARRMVNLADYEKGCGRTVICDFVCPTNLTRHIFDANITIWMDTVNKSKYTDTDNLFEKPDSKKVDYRVVRHLSDKEIKEMYVKLRNTYEF